MAWDAELRSLTKIVLVRLADQANDAGTCYPSIADVAEKCSMSPRQVQREIDALHDLGYITKDPKPGRVAHYVIHIGYGGVPLLTPDRLSGVDRVDYARRVAAQNVADEKERRRQARESGRTARGAKAQRQSGPGGGNPSGRTPDSQSGVQAVDKKSTPDSLSGRGDSRSGVPTTVCRTPMTDGRTEPSLNPLSQSPLNPRPDDLKKSGGRDPKKVEDREAPTPEEIERRKAEQLERIREKGIEV